MEKIIKLEEAATHIKNGCNLMVSGFLGLGSPELLIDTLIEKGTKDLNLITSDTAFADVSVGKLISMRRVKTLVSSHIGTNKHTMQQWNEGSLFVTLVPQGTLARRIHAGGSGLGGFLTRVGMGTEVEKGKEKFMVDGQEYLLEKPLKADVAILAGAIVDTYGNTYLKGTGKNFVQVMAMAAKTVIMEADEIVPCGEIDPSSVHVPGVFIDYIVQGRAKK